MRSIWRSAVARCIHPIARLYIRYLPFAYAKTFIWRRLHWWERDYIVSTRFGVRMAGRANDMVQGYIYYFGIWEPNLTAFVERRLRADGSRTFVDIGANVGYFALLAAKLLVRGRVVAIEAFPSIFAALEGNIALNRFSNIRAVQCAVTDSTCVLDMFHAGPDNEGRTTTTPGRFLVPPTSVVGDTLVGILTNEEIESTRLLKIDVEGAEYSVIQGLRPLLKRFPADVEIAVEIAPSVMGTERLLEVFAIFKNEGFFAYELRNSYASAAYLRPTAICKPQRMKGPPATQTDIVFSRIDAGEL